MIRKLLPFAVFLLKFSGVSTAQSSSIILGRPTDNSITASVLQPQSMDAYFVFGLQSGVYTDSTTVQICAGNVPQEIDMTGLFPDSRYYYRMKTRPAGSGAGFLVSPEYSFHTQRAHGSSFTFTIEADEHLYDKKGVDSEYRLTLQNQANDQPDFMLSLGDIFGDDHNPTTITSGALDTLHLNYRPFLDRITHSIPFYVCLGNHEGENDYYLGQNPPNNLAVWATQWRKNYYPNPYPNGFYSGNTAVEPFGIGNPENYYAWQWGDALFIVLDVYRDQNDTAVKPQKWAWSLGQPQYDWLKQTLDTSTAQYKFVFAHHVRGQGRGGVTNARLYEWGGYEQDGVTYSFPTNRPGWAAPIHQLFVNHGVNIFFQGHDHLFAHEEMDGVTYQEVPMAADSTYEIGMLANAGAYLSDTIEGSGHIRVNVTPNCVTVDFIRAYLPADTVSGLHHNGEVGFSYSVGNCTAGIQNTANNRDMKVYPNPVNDRLLVQCKSLAGNPIYEISNLMGARLKVSTYPEIDVRDLPDGMYVLTATSGSDRLMTKIIVRH